MKILQSLLFSLFNWRNNRSHLNVQLSRVNLNQNCGILSRFLSSLPSFFENITWQSCFSAVTLFWAPYFSNIFSLEKGWIRILAWRHFEIVRLFVFLKIMYLLRCYQKTSKVHTINVAALHNSFNNVTLHIQWISLLPRQIANLYTISKEKTESLRQAQFSFLSASTFI